jgi:small-conductance mechanosensitive channel
MNAFLSNLIAHPMFMKGVVALTTTIVILVLVGLIQATVSKKIDDRNIRYKTRKAIGFIGYVIIFIALLIIFSEQMKNLTVIIGALSVGIGFAMRELIQSIIGWLAVSFWGLYSTGDRIQMGGIMGDVIDVSPLTTTVMECGGWVKGDLYNGRLVRLSNSLVFKDPIINYTVDFPFLWDEIVIPVRTDSDHRLARDIIEKSGLDLLTKVSDESKAAWKNFAMRYRVEDARLEPMVTMTFDANWIEFTLRYVVDYKARRGTKDKLFSNILAGFEETHGKVQIASASFQLTEVPTLKWQRANAVS